MRHIFLLVVRRYYLLDRLCVRVLCMCYLVGGEACLGALSMCGRHCSERGFTVCTRAERGRGRIDKSINVMVPPLRQQSNNLMHCRQTDRQTLAAARAQSQAVHRSRGREGFGGEGGGGSSNDRPSLPSFVLLFWRLIYMCISSTDTTEVLGKTTSPKLREMPACPGNPYLAKLFGLGC